MATGPALEDLDVLRARVATRRAEVEARRRGRPAAELLCRLPASIGRIGASGTLEETGYHENADDSVGRSALDFIPPASRAWIPRARWRS